MAITVDQLHDLAVDEEDGGITYDTAWLVDGTADENLARTEVLNQAPIFLNGAARSELSLKSMGPTSFKAKLMYRGASTEFGGNGEVEASGFGFDITTENTRITHGTQVKSYTKEGVNPDDFQGALNIQDTYGENPVVQGLDIPTAIGQFHEIHERSVSSITYSYYRTIMALVGSYNATSFRGFPPGEVMFLGARGSRSGLLTVPVSYYFNVSPNVGNLTIGEVEVDSKFGFEVLDVKVIIKRKAGAKVAVPEVRQVDKIRVAPPGLFQTLGIGTN